MNGGPGRGSKYAMSDGHAGEFREGARETGSRRRWGMGASVGQGRDRRRDVGLGEGIGTTGRGSGGRGVVEAEAAEGDRVCGDDGGAGRLVAEGSLTVVRLRLRRRFSGGGGGSNGGEGIGDETPVFIVTFDRSVVHWWWSLEKGQA